MLGLGGFIEVIIRDGVQMITFKAAKLGPLVGGLRTQTFATIAADSMAVRWKPGGVKTRKVRRLFAVKSSSVKEDASSLS